MRTSSAGVLGRSPLKWAKLRHKTQTMEMGDMRLMVLQGVSLKPKADAKLQVQYK